MRKSVWDSGLDVQIVFVLICTRLLTHCGIVHVNVVVCAPLLNIIYLDSLASADSVSGVDASDVGISSHCTSFACCAFSGCS